METPKTGFLMSQFQNVGKLLYESREVVKSQQFEIDDLKQKLSDAQGDIKVIINVPLKCLGIRSFATETLLSALKVWVHN